MKTKSKKYPLLIGAVILLLAVTAALVLLLTPREAGAPSEPSPTVTPAPTAAPKPTPTPVPATPEPVITPPADYPEDAASASDVQLWLELPATSSDIGP